MRSTSSLFACAALLFVSAALPRTAHAANVLFVADGTSDMGIATALTADGHTVTVALNDLSDDGTSTALAGPLDAYDVIFWSGDGCSGGFHDPATFANLTAFVMGGGRVFYTGYDSTYGDPGVPAFLGFSSGNDDVGGRPTALSSTPSSLTSGVRDITGLVPSDGYSDKDCETGPMAGVLVLSEDSSFRGCAQWSVRTLGEGEIAWVSNGTCGGDERSWTDTSTTFNAAIRNFAYAADSSSGVCTGSPDGAACTSGTGVTGTCHTGRCCTGCWDGAACRSGRTTATCGIGGSACMRCTAVSFCESDMCTDGVCGGSPCDDGESCTTDSCDEALDRCDHVVTSGCIVGGECVTEGDHHIAYPCLVCDSARNPSDWSPVAEGSSCGADRCASGRVFQGGTCDDAGECIAPHVEICETMTCHDGTTCEPPCTETSCGSGARCTAMGVCQRLSLTGEACAATAECAGGTCADGVCCTTACDGVCESCALPGKAGVCTAIADGTDPYAECSGGRTCDGAGACRTMGPHDAGIDGGPRADGGVTADANAGFDGGTIEAPRGGCSALPGSGANGGLVLAALGLMMMVRRRGRPGPARRM
jgi:hypothetical protein